MVYTDVHTESIILYLSKFNALQLYHKIFKLQEKNYSFIYLELCRYILVIYNNVKILRNKYFMEEQNEKII